MRRPRPVRVGDVVAHPMRPPTARDPRWYWRARRTDDGQTTTILTGRFDRAELVDRLAAAIRDAPARAGRLSTLSELLRAYTAHRAVEAVPPGEPAGPGQITARTLELYRRRRRWIVARWGDLPLEPVAALQQAIRLAAYGELDRVKHATVAAHLDLLRAAWTWGGNAGLVAGVLELPPIRPERRARAPVTLVELAATIDELHGRPSTGVDVVDGLRLLRETGLRCGALGKLRRDDVDLVGLELRVQHKTAARLVPVLPGAVPLLSRLVLRAEPGGLLLPQLEARACSTINEAIDRSCRRRGVRRFTSHAIRRRFAVDLVRAGVPVHVYAAIMGHTPETAARHYLLVEAEDRAAAADALASYRDGEQASKRRAR